MRACNIFIFVLVQVENMIEISWIRIWIEAGWADKMTFGIPVNLMDAYLPVCYCPVKKSRSSSK